MKKQYKVSWTIEVDADSPRAAAIEAMDCIINGSARVFKVNPPVRKRRPDGRPGVNRSPAVWVDLEGAR